MISINGTLLVQLLNFLIITFILNRVMFRPLLKINRERSLHFEKTREEIEALNKKTEGLTVKIEEKKRSAKSEADEKRRLLKEEGEGKANTFIGDAQSSVISLNNEIDEQIRKEMTRVRPSLQSEAEAMVDSIMEKIIGRRIAA